MTDRIVSGNGSDNITAMAMMVYSLPQGAETDAIVALPGMGEHWRLTHPISVWQQSTTTKHLLIAGQNNRERNFIPTTLETLAKPPFNLKKTEGVVIAGHMEHTREQAEWIALQVKERDIKSLTLCVSAYHLLRAFLTVLRTFGKGNIKVAMIPAPIPVSPSLAIPETGSESWEMIPGETRRIVAYQEKGDVATYAELREYICWLWKKLGSNG